MKKIAILYQSQHMNMLRDIKMMIQLNPMITVWTKERGYGYALGWKDYSQEHNMLWIIAFDDTGEIWEVPNPQVRLQKNYSMGRFVE
jgi:hypothetical protein